MERPNRLTVKMFGFQITHWNILQTLHLMIKSKHGYKPNSEDLNF